MSVVDVVDASDHFHDVPQPVDDVPSLCAIILDTNPLGWAALGSALPISKAIPSILVFVNAHLALNNANQVQLIASHPSRAAWLYPPEPRPLPDHADARDSAAPPSAATDKHGRTPHPPPTKSAISSAKPPQASKKLLQFAAIESAVLQSLRALIRSTTEADLDAPTRMAGALTLALARINKIALTFRSPSMVGASSSADAGAGTQSGGGSGTTGHPSGGPASQSGMALSGLQARILILSVSDSDPAQYIATMNAISTAAAAGIAIDTLALRGSPTYLQQASFNTRGAYMQVKSPQGLLQYLMFLSGGGSAPSGGISGGAVIAHRSSGGKPAPPGGKAGATGTGAQQQQPTVSAVAAVSRLGANPAVSNLLVTPSADAVDFRTACFCHSRVVDMGFVCSICLCIFCEPPEDGECLTCGTKLALGKYGPMKKP